MPKEGWSKIEALKSYFETPEKPVTFQELMELRKSDPKGYAELAELAQEALEKCSAT